MLLTTLTIIPVLGRAKDSFNRTAITTTQHLEHVGDGNQRQIYTFEKSKGYTLRKLPTDYGN